MNKKVRFAVVGFGHIGKRHAQTILENNEAELIAVVDINGNYEGEVVNKLNAQFFKSL
ncbi:MAG TPA: Gfo/Idh/MocA family oxidoreductase, partial [Cytophagaceae bacterium]